MKNPGLLLSLIAALAAAPAMAQDTETTAPAVTATEAPADTAQTPVGGDLDTGEEVPAVPQQAQQGPQLYIKETFQDWQMQCLKVPQQSGAEEEVCQMFQLLKDAEGNNVAEVTIAKLEGGKPGPAGGTFIVPLQTLLTKKLAVSVDGAQPRLYDFSFCTTIGCFARVAFSAEDIARFKAGAKATVSLTPMVAPDQVVTVNMSLSGFTAAYDAASTVRP